MYVPAKGLCALDYSQRQLRRLDLLARLAMIWTIGRIEMTQRLRMLPTLLMIVLKVDRKRYQKVLGMEVMRMMTGKTFSSALHPDRTLLRVPVKCTK